MSYKRRGVVIVIPFYMPIIANPDSVQKYLLEIIYFL
jgi:hypothetical protein